MSTEDENERRRVGRNADAFLSGRSRRCTASCWLCSPPRTREAGHRIGEARTLRTLADSFERAGDDDATTGVTASRKRNGSGEQATAARLAVIMSAIDLFKIVLRDRIGPALRSAGFEGSRTTWSHTAPDGNRAIINAQSSRLSSSSEVIFTVNLAALPGPWWSWQQHLLGARARTPKEYDGVWRDRLHARVEVRNCGERWWSVRDSRSAERCADDVLAQLADTGLPRLHELLDRDAMLDAVRSRALGYGPAYTLAPLAVLLADRGPSAELDEVIARLAAEPDLARHTHNRRLLDWIRQRR